MNITPIVAGNWKMHKTPTNGKSYVAETVDLLLNIEHIAIIFAPPFTGLFDMDVKPPFHKAAQNCHWEEQGAFTGEISVAMIKDCGAAYVILGHSERRHIFGETDSWINRKIHAVLDGGLQPIFCIGETLEQRKAEQTELVLRTQLEQGLAGVTSLKGVVIAYEPVWAIGTGVTAQEDQVQAAHATVRQILSDRFDENDSVPVLYGGSVKPDNAEALIQVPGVNGFLIGGASLDAASFTSIANSVEQVQMRKS